MPIARIKPHETITAEKLNKIIDAYNAMEQISSAAASLLTQSAAQNQANQTIIDEFMENFSDKIEQQPGIFETLELFQAIRNSGVIASAREFRTPVSFSVFYGTPAEINAMPLSEGQMLIDINSGTIHLDVIDATSTLVRRVAPNSTQIMPEIAIQAGYWTVDGVSTGVAAEGIGTQGATGPRGLPGKAIRLETINTDPHTDTGTQLGTTELACEAFMSTAYMYSNKLYAPYLTGDSQAGFVGNYTAISDFAVSYEIRENKENGLYFGAAGASTNPNDYTIWINGNNTGVLARGPQGVQGPQGIGWYVHKFYSAMDWDPDNSTNFFNQLTLANDNSSYVVIISGSKLDNSGAPMLASRPNAATLISIYNGGNVSSAEFNVYALPIKPLVTVPTVTETSNGYQIEWSLEEDTAVNALPTIEILHGHGLQPIGRFATQDLFNEYLSANAATIPDYFTFTMPVDSTGTLNVSVDYLYAYVNKTTQVFLGRVSGPTGAQGATGLTGAKGETGATGATGSRGSLLFHYNQTTWNGFTNDTYKLKSTIYQSTANIPATYFATFSNAGSIQAGDYIVDPNSNLGLVYYVSTSVPKTIDVITIAILKGPTGAQGPTGPTGSTGPAGPAGTSVAIKGNFDAHTSLPSTGQTLGDGYLINGYLWVYTGGADSGTPPAVGSVYNGFLNAGSIQGPQGATGADGAAGADGADGKDIELQVTSTHIEWRYIGDPTWTTLIALSAITGATGPQGATGVSISSITNTYKESSTTAQPESGWTDIATATAAMSPTIKYLWKKSVILFSDASTDTKYEIVAIYGQTGPQGLTGNTGATGPTGPSGATFSYNATTGVLTLTAPV